MNPYLENKFVEADFKTKGNKIMHDMLSLREEIQRIRQILHSKNFTQLCKFIINEYD